MEAYPQPDRLRHLLSQTRFGTGMETCTAKTLQRRTSRARLDNPAFTGSPEGRPTHLLAKGNAIRCTQGAFRCVDFPEGVHFLKG